MMTQALSEAMGTRGIACDTGTSGVAVIGGVDERPGHEGSPWGSFAVPGGGWGGTWTSDGVSACIVSIAANCRSAVNEHVERESPLVIWEHELMPDSAGAGLHRGGAGAIFTIGAVSTTVITITGDRSRSGAPGSSGGGRGMPFYGWLLRGDGSGSTLDPRKAVEAQPLFGVFDENGEPDPDNGTFGLGTTYMGGKVSQLVLQPGDGIRLIVGGGGGWGDPLERDTERVLTDIDDGLVSESFAHAAYGVVLDGSGRVDEDATAMRRRDLSRLRDQDEWRVPTACPPAWNAATIMEVAS
jgi:N-methylhydantoinase B